MLSYSTLLHIMQTIRRDTESLQRILSNDIDTMPEATLAQLELILKKHQKTLDEVEHMIRHIRMNKPDINETYYEG